MQYGNFKGCWFSVSRYRSNDRLFIGLVNDEGPIIDLTTNIADADLADDELAINAHNSGNVNMVEWMVQNKVATNTGKHVRSGYVEFPIMKVLPEFFNKYEDQFNKHL